MAKTIYIGQVGQGAQDGLSVTTRRGVGYFNSSLNWGSGTQQIGPGDTVYLWGTFTTRLNCGGNGSAGNPITISPSPGQTTTIDVPDSGNPGTIAFDFAGRQYIYLDGVDGNKVAGDTNYRLIITNVAGTATMQYFAINNNSNNGINNKILHVKVIITGLVDQPSDTGGGIYYNTSGTLVPANIEIAYNWITGVSAPNKDGAGITHFAATVGTSFTSHSLIHHNHVEYLTDDGIRSPSNSSTYNNYISSIGGSGHSDGIIPQGASYAAVYNNTLDDGADIFIFAGVSGAASGHIRVYNNVVFNRTGGSFGVELSAQDANTIDDVVIANNTFWDLGGVGTAIKGSQNKLVSNVVIVNNLLGKSATYKNIHGDSGFNITYPSLASLDYNVYQPGGSGYAASGFIYNIDATPPALSLAGLQGVGREVNGKVGTPSFANQAAHDYHLTESDIVAKGFGVNLTSTYSFLATDKDGMVRPLTGPWDIGAYSQPIVSYPLVPGLSLSPTYTMTVDGVNVPVQSYSGHSFAWFAFSGTVNVIVTVNATVNTYTLSPLRNPTSSTKSGATVNFSLSAPKKLVLHKVNAIAEKLFIFGDAHETSPPASSGTGIYNVVTGYGADNTGVVAATTAINNAINAATAFGAGSVVYVPAGLYTVNAAVILKANVNFYLASGAVIKNLAGSYTSSIAYHINKQDNVTISGRGVLYGNGTAIGSYNNLLTTGAASGTMTNFTIQDVMLLDSRSTALRIANTLDSHVTNAKILSGSPNLSDGIDTDGVTNLTVDRSFIWSSDDNLAIGSGSSSYSYNVGTATDGYTIQNSLFYQTSTGHVISIVPVVGVVEQNILFENNDSISVDGALAAYAANGNTADMHHITFRNIRLEEVRTKPIDLISTDFTVGWGGCPNGFCFAGNGKIHHIIFDNVLFDTFGTTNSQFYGYSATQNIDAVNFNAVYMAGTLVTNAATAHLTIGSFVTNVTYTNNSPDVLPPATPINIRVS